MVKDLKPANIGIKSENHLMVAFLVGRLYDQMPDKYSDWDEIALLVEGVVIDWTNKVDIKTDEEEGYIQAYAERVIRERLPKIY